MHEAVQFCRHHHYSLAFLGLAPHKHYTAHLFTLDLHNLYVSIQPTITLDENGAHHALSSIVSA